MGEFVMPALGADMSAGTLLEWRKAPGDSVVRGDIIAEVHTDKADIEVEVFTAGVIEKLLVEPGTEVPVGTPLALIRENGKAPAEAAPAPAPPTPAAAAAPPVPTPVPTPAAAPAEVTPQLLASPSAKALAKELGVELAGLHGSGPGGRIQRRDVEQAAAAAPAPAAPPVTPPAPTPAAAPPTAAPPAPPTAAAPAPPPPPRPAPAAPSEAADKQAAMRRAIAAAMARSKREIPHFYLSETIDLSTALRFLADENAVRSVQERLLPGVLLLKAVALALREVPELNATWQGEQVVRSEQIHLGVAIFLRGGGLVAPAIHDADTLSLDELMRAFRDLVTRARAGQLRSSEFSDPTITVTSLGERGAETAYPIIFPPQVAIVGFGRIVDRPWISEGRVMPCPVVTATLAGDHRVTDGHRAGAFLIALDRLLKEPESL